VLRKILKSKGKKITGCRRKLHTEGLHDSVPSPNIAWIIISRKMRWEGHVASVMEKRNAYRVIMDKPEGKRPHGRSARRWEGNIKIDLKEISGEGVNWSVWLRTGSSDGLL
jgi:hypothetical protein